MTPAPRVYLAGPTVFRADAREEGARLKALCRQHGLEGVYPLDGEIGVAGGGGEAIRSIYRSCCAQIESCQAVIADLSPFRGPHADDGTAFEVGYAAARGLPIVGYSRDRSALVERVVVASVVGGAQRDAEGYEIENFGHSHNAMLAGAVQAMTGSAEEAVQLLANLLRP